MAQEKGTRGSLGVPVFVVTGGDELCRLGAAPAQQIQAHAGGSNYSLMGDNCVGQLSRNVASTEA